MDDLEDDDGTKIAMVGKLLAPSKFHIQTITSALRPQWGNPRGLTFQAMGDNVFVAHLEKEQDRKRIWEGAPWMVNNHAVVLDDFETSMRPSEVRFGRIPVWVQCHDLPFNWLNTKRAENIASQIGEVIKLDTTGNSRGWRQSLWARIWLDVAEPIQRCIPINSQKPTDNFGSWSATSVRAADPRKIKKEPGVSAARRFDTAGASSKQPQLNPFKFQPQPGFPHGENPFAGVMKDGSASSGNQETMQFTARGRGRGGNKPNAVRHLAFGGQMYAPKTVVVPVTEHEGQGIKRNALMNSPSKIDSEAIDLKKKRATGESGELSDSEDMEGNTILAEAADLAPPVPMTCISWNCRGLGNPETVHELHDLVRLEGPAVVFLIETKITGQRARGLT
ncbi:hypothetical protein ACQ4PT_069012 [Festuca glaucescens]